MWWFDRLTALALPLAVAACGFTPVYAPGTGASALRGTVTVEGGQTVFDYRLRTTLEDRLGQGSGSVLAFVARTDEVQAAVTPDGTITRFNVTGEADWVLTDAGGGELARGTARGFTSYLTTGSTVATDAAQQDAEARLAVVLADQIVARLLVTLGPG